MDSIATLSPRTEALLHQELIQHHGVISLKCCPADTRDHFALLPVAVLLSLAPERCDAGSICGLSSPSSQLCWELSGCLSSALPPPFCLCFVDSLALTPLFPGVAWCLCSSWLLRRALGLRSVG